MQVRNASTIKRYFIAKMNVLLNIQLHKIDFASLNSMDDVAQQRNASDVLYYATLLNIS